MKSIEESVVEAMDGSDAELFPFLPYILQDLWEIGSDPAIIISLVRKHFRDPSRLKVLDLGCGKGAVSVRLSETCGCSCLGIDAIGAFIEDAREKAVEYGVSHLCAFEVGDIRTWIKTLKDFDLIILGSIGPVLGDHITTLSALSPVLGMSGAVILDDGYLEDTSTFEDPSLRKRAELIEDIQSAGMLLIDEVIMPRDEIKTSDDFIFKQIEGRCKELIQKYPDRKHLFETYVRQQQDENDVLENRIICSAMVIKKDKIARNPLQILPILFVILL